MTVNHLYSSFDLGGRWGPNPCTLQGSQSELCTSVFIQLWRLHPSQRYFLPTEANWRCSDGSRRCEIQMPGLPIGTVPFYFPGQRCPSKSHQTSDLLSRTDKDGEPGVECKKGQNLMFLGARSAHTAVEYSRDPCLVLLDYHNGLLGTAIQ
ncbi:chemerin-like receptor 2 isoform X3 [Caretta caretta]|uniref:chemerin-like receptor 2 isoform X3 n=1 Tax=Caretta caretta TaxID=8467 RepID=UPI003F4C998A